MHLLPDPCSAPRERRRSLIRPVQVLAASLVAVSALGACTSVASLVTPYKIDIQQGNVVSQEAVSKLKPGMTKSQVRFIMGTPLVTDAFHANRWDYVYRYQKDGKVTEERKVALIFEGDALKRVEGDVVPAAGEQKAPAEPPKAADAPAKKEEKGFFGKMLEKIGL